MIIGIIDDDEAVRDSTYALLESYGYEARLYDSAESYLASAKDELRCLLVDQHMPGLSGLDLLERLRNAGNAIPAFLITGRDDALMRDRARQMGITIFRKPVAEHMLIATIAQVQVH